MGKINDELLLSLHQKLFPEEYDVMADSISDHSDRKKGQNPMASDYTKEVNRRRKRLGLSPFLPNQQSNETLIWLKNQLINDNHAELAALMRDLDIKE